MTIADSHVDEMQGSLAALMRVLDNQLPVLERELAEIREAVGQAANAIYDATLYDPEGQRDDD
jgi:hypothetical protein